MYSFQASTSYRPDLELPDELDDQEDEDHLDSSSDKKTDIKPKLRLVKRYSSNLPIELQEVSKEMTNAFNTLSQALKSSKRRREQSSREEDDCDLYGRIMARRLRQFSETERMEIMYELDGLMLSRCTGGLRMFSNSDLSDS